MLLACNFICASCTLRLTTDIVFNRQRCCDRNALQTLREPSRCNSCKSGLRARSSQRSDMLLREGKQRIYMVLLSSTDDLNEILWRLPNPSASWMRCFLISNFTDVKSYWVDIVLTLHLWRCVNYIWVVAANNFGGFQLVQMVVCCTGEQSPQFWCMSLRSVKT